MTDRVKPWHEEGGSTIEAGRADMEELCKRATDELLAMPEPEPERDAAPTETYGIVAQRLWSGPAGDLWQGAVIGQLPGATADTVVTARTCDGLVAMAHRAYLQALTAGCVCDAPTARRRAAEAEFYIATVV